MAVNTIKLVQVGQLNFENGEWMWNKLVLGPL